MRRKYILVVGADAGQKTEWIRHLGAFYHLLFAPNTGDAERALDAVLLDAVLLNERWDGFSGTQWLLGLRTALDVPVLLLSSSRDPGGAVRALRAGASDCLDASVDLAVLRRRLDALLEAPVYRPRGSDAPPFALRAARQFAEAVSGFEQDLEEAGRRLSTAVVLEAMDASRGVTALAARRLDLTEPELLGTLQALEKNPARAS